MVSYLEGEVEQPELSDAAHPLHSWRHGIMSFLLDHWKQLETQVTCPAKSKDSRACFGCIDTQVVACLIQNSENETLIELHKPKEEK